MPIWGNQIRNCLCNIDKISHSKSPRPTLAKHDNFIPTHRKPAKLLILNIFDDQLISAFWKFSEKVNIRVVYNGNVSINIVLISSLNMFLNSLWIYFMLLSCWNKNIGIYEVKINVCIIKYPPQTQIKKSIRLKYEKSFQFINV